VEITRRAETGPLSGPWNYDGIVVADLAALTTERLSAIGCP
jgi:hypothetical protein